MLSFSTSGCGLGWEYKNKTNCTPHLHAGEVERLDAYQILISIEEKLRKINEILSFLDLSTRKIVKGSNSDTFLWFLADLMRRSRGTNILPDVVLSSLEFWLEISHSDLLIRQISMLHRILTRFDILFEILQCLTEISLKFTWKSAILAKVEPRMPWSYGNPWSLTLNRWGETPCVLRSAFGFPLFCFSSTFTSFLAWLPKSSRSVLSISEGEGEDTRVRSHAQAPPMRVRANAWMPRKSLDLSFRKLSTRKMVKGSKYDTFIWFLAALMRRSRGTIILPDVVLSSLVFWLEMG